MNVFSHPEFDQHEHLSFFCDAETGLKAIVAIHNTSRGPALGGCRMYPYATDEEALRDVLRLSRGMTYKSALANLDLGGGKSVIIGDPRRHKTEGLLEAMGRHLETLGGRYIAAEDSGTSVPDLKVMGRYTRHVAGIAERTGFNGLPSNGDPSPATAYGTFIGLKAAVRHKYGQDDLKGLKVAIQGVGNVGFRLARHLRDAGAELWVYDIHADNMQRAVEQLGAKPATAEDIRWTWSPPAPWARSSTTAAFPNCGPVLSPAPPTTCWNVRSTMPCSSNATSFMPRTSPSTPAASSMCSTSVPAAARSRCAPTSRPSATP